MGLLNMTTNNLIINGNFDLWQRGTTFSIPYNADYSNVGKDGTTFTAESKKIADRWYVIDTQKRSEESGGVISIYREAFNSTEPEFARSLYYLTVANNITAVTSGYCYIENKQANCNIVGGSTLRLSFSAKTTGITGTTMACYFRQAVNPGIYEFSNTNEIVTVYETWQNYSVTLNPQFVGNLGVSGDHYFSVGFKVLPNTQISIAKVGLNFSGVSSQTLTTPEEEKKLQEKYYYTSYTHQTSPGNTTLSSGNDVTAINFTVTPSYSYTHKFSIPQYKTPTITLYSPKSGTANDGYNKSADRDMRLTSGTRGWNTTARFSPTGAATITTSGNTYGVIFSVASGAVIFDDILVHMVADADIDPSPYDRGLETTT
jgi:hypothetical protein